MKNDWNMGAAYDLLPFKHGVLMLRYFVEAGLVTGAACGLFVPSLRAARPFLAMTKAEYYDEAPKFHDRMEKFFAGYSQ